MRTAILTYKKSIYNCISTCKKGGQNNLRAFLAILQWSQRKLNKWCSDWLSTLVFKARIWCEVLRESGRGCVLVFGKSASSIPLVLVWFCSVKDTFCCMPWVFYVREWGWEICKEKIKHWLKPESVTSYVCSTDLVATREQTTRIHSYLDPYTFWNYDQLLCANYICERWFHILWDIKVCECCSLWKTEFFSGNDAKWKSQKNGAIAEIFKEMNACICLFEIK